MDSELLCISEWGKKRGFSIIAGLENAPGTTKAPYTFDFTGKIRTLNTLSKLESNNKKDQFDLQPIDSTETRVGILFRILSCHM